MKKNNQLIMDIMMCIAALVFYIAVILEGYESMEQKFRCFMLLAIYFQLVRAMNC